MPQQLTGLGRMPLPSTFPAGDQRNPARRSLVDANTDRDADPPRLVRVLAQHTERWLVAGPEDPDHAWLVHARGRLREDPAAPPVTGDWVWLDDSGAIAAIHPRTGAIIRRAAGEATRPQVVAAGVDLALIAEPATSPNPRRAERFAALAAAGGADAVLVLTKADLVDDPDGAATREARDAGIVDGLAVSAQSGEGLGILRTLLPPDTTAVLLGPSGAGKSTLANALLGEDRQATGEIRASDGRGRHTTVTRELLRLPWGALLLDTPGVREIGLWDDGTSGAFADVAVLAAECRFGDCSHAGEPGCAVQAGVDPERLAAWHKLQREQAWIDDRRGSERQREALGRHYGKVQRAARKAKGNE